MNQPFFHQFESLRDGGFLSPVDIEFCRFLAETESDIHKSVLTAACLVSSAYGGGDVCISLEEYSGRVLFGESGNKGLRTPELDKWLITLTKSSVTGEPGDFKPLILDDNHRLYLHKLWKHEQSIAAFIREKINGTVPDVDIELLKGGIQRLFKDSQEQPDWQKTAASIAVNQLFTVISGGPGTGKTSTVIRLLILLLEQGRRRGHQPNIALAAPTGKAAARLQESIDDIPKNLASADILAQIPEETVTLHHLLGAGRHTSKFRYHRENLLPYDCVIVDEASMVDQTLMARLMQALAPRTRLVLLGDKDQLASVEAGAVLGDICGGRTKNKFTPEANNYMEKLNIRLPEKHISSRHDGLANHINLLQKSYRFTDQSGIGRLVEAIHAGNPGKARQLLDDERRRDISFNRFKSYKAFIEMVSKKIIQQFKRVQDARSPEEMLAVYRQFKLLGVHRKGPWGVETLNQALEKELQKHGLILPDQSWYEGRPVIVNSNDFSLGLSNGDMGVCKKDENNLTVFFDKEEDGIALPVSRLSAHSTAFALTVHKSQGSEFDEVLLVLPEASSKLLQREMLYTAVSRARDKVTIVGSDEAFNKTINRRIERTSGLKDKLWK